MSQRIIQNHLNLGIRFLVLEEFVMIKIKTRIICIISISIVFLLMIAPVRVNSEYKKIGDIPINKETSIPQELNFNVSNSIIVELL